MMLVIKIVWLTLMLVEIFCVIGIFLVLPEECRGEGGKSLHDLLWGNTVTDHILLTLSWCSGVMGVLILRTIIKEWNSEDPS